MKTIFSLIPGESDPQRGLLFEVSGRRLARFLGVESSDVPNILPKDHIEWNYVGSSDADYSGFTGYFKTAEDVNRFLQVVSQTTSRSSK